MEQGPQYCPSCRSETTGIYCPACGEKVKIDKSELTLGHFLKDAFEELFNFDSKFVKTIRYLIFRPGFLTNEILAGKRVDYIKPFRIYTIIVVVHFLAFSFFKSGDIFTIDRFPFFQMIPGFHEWINQYEVKSGLSHVIFTDTLNQNLKDNLDIILYFLVFLLALYFKVLYAKSGKYYIEHLYYLLHMISFGLIRNIVFIPLVILDLMIVAFPLVIASQLLYTWISLKNVYRESNSITTFKMFAAIFGFVLVFLPGILLALVIGMIQIMF